MGRVVDDGSYDGTPTPLAGVEKDDFTITVDAYPNWYIKGPYFFFFNGQPDPLATATKRATDPMTGKYKGGLFVLFVEVPLVGPNSRDVEIRAQSYAEGLNLRYFGPLTTKVFRGGFSWVTLREGGVAPPPPPPPPGEVTFETQVYPLFLPVNQGGFGCLGCHTNEGGIAPAGNMNLYGGPQMAYQALDPARYPQRVNVANPGASYLLTKPLYEPDGNQNHPIFAFVSAQEPAYKTIYDWISAGALYEGQVPIEPVSFYNEIRTLLYRPIAEGGIGCYDCHVSGVDANTAPGGAYYGGDGNALYYELTQETPTDDGQTGEPYRINKQGNIGASLLLTNPLVGSPEPHQGKIITNANDPNYQKIYRWIQEGYVNDTP
jgi:mono/diheme cytochrome c family protein